MRCVDEEDIVVPAYGTVESCELWRCQVTAIGLRFDVCRLVDAISLIYQIIEVYLTI